MNKYIKICGITVLLTAVVIGLNLTLRVIKEGKRGKTYGINLIDASNRHGLCDRDDSVGVAQVSSALSTTNTNVGLVIRERMNKKKTQ